MNMNRLDFYLTKMLYYLLIIILLFYYNIFIVSFPYFCTIFTFLFIYRKIVKSFSGHYLKNSIFLHWQTSNIKTELRFSKQILYFENLSFALLPCLFLPLNRIVPFSLSPIRQMEDLLRLEFSKIGKETRRYFQ